MDRDDDGHDDADRAAILARRRQFIALALASLSGAAACRPSRPQPCLSPPMQHDPADDVGADEAGADEAGADEAGADEAGAAPAERS